MAVPNGKKPVSNLSSALASIHLTRPNQATSQQPYSSSAYPQQQQQQQQQPSYADERAYPQTRNNDFNKYDRSQQSNDPRDQYNPIDIPMMRSQPEYQIPEDRIGEYRKNPPTEGVTLFSHRVR